MEHNSSRPAKLNTKTTFLRYFFAIIIFGFGLLTIDTFSNKWLVLTLVFYGLPLIAQLIPSTMIQVNALWFGGFLVAQAILSAIIVDPDYRTLPANFNKTVDIKGTSVPGIEGRHLVTTDDKGFRVTRSVDYQADNTLRIFAIGGSTTEQIFLSDEHTWTHLLQELLQKDFQQTVEIINTGASGLRIRHHYATLKKITDLYPDLVIILVGINDWNYAIRDYFSDGALTRESTISWRERMQIRRTLLGSAIAAVADNTVSAESRNQVEIIDTAKLLQSARSLERKPVHEFKPTEVYSEYSMYLDKISQFCIQKSIPCMLVSQPTSYDPQVDDAFKSYYWMTPPYESYTVDFASLLHISQLYNNQLKTFANSNNIPFCDLASMTQPNEDYFYDDTHYNQSGGKKIAEHLYTCTAPILSQSK